MCLCSVVWFSAVGSVPFHSAHSATLNSRPCLYQIGINIEIIKLVVLNVKNDCLRVDVSGVQINTKNMMTTANIHRIEFDNAIRVNRIERPPFLKQQDLCETDNGHKNDSSSTSTTATTTNTTTTTANNQITDLRREADRLKTFTNWPNKSISPELLAKAGFYCLHHEDAVRCAFCGTEGNQWVDGDDPLEDHKNWSPNCPFLNSCNQTTTPSIDSVGTTNSNLLRSNGQDVCGIEYFPNSIPENETFKLLERIGLEKTKPCVYSNYTQLINRLQSFTDWPKSLKQKPDKLAEAGFFYKGVGDQTLCFHCGGGLKDWEDDDDPWEQHALWFPKCNFLLLRKGNEFVKNVQDRFKAGEPQSPTSSSSSSASYSSTKQTTKDEINKEKTKCKSEDSSNCNYTKENNASLCKICYKNEVGIVFIPCGHVVACVDCAMSLKDTCPVCRKRFEATIRAFLS